MADRGLNAGDPADPLAYAAVPGVHDEMVGADGELRDHWRYVIGSLRLLGRHELGERRAEARQLLRQDGATHGATTSGERTGPWELDPVPLLVASDEWATIEAGLVQRAELLDLLLADIYGPQEVVQRGLLPAEVVHASPAFLRPAVGVVPPGAHRLVLYGADVARRADGTLQVIADHAATPTGLGYALQNRTVLSRVLPSLFRDAHVHRLAHFFRGLRGSLDALAPAGPGEPRIVILTPGPAGPAYFEQSSLAAYLGYPLVEPADLTVRRGRVWLRSLAGLEQVDVIVRAVPDDLADPLELRRDSRLGVPGLVEAARRGTVALANPLGTGIVESPGILPFLPALAEALLGGPLALPSVASWWAGRDLEQILDELAALELLAVDAPIGAAPVVGAALRPAELDRWRDAVRHAPWRWVARVPATGSTAPTFVGSGLAARPVGVRALLAARGGTYVALPGGVARVAPPDEPGVVPAGADLLAGAWLKDVWVLASEPERQGTSLLPDRGRPAEDAPSPSPAGAGGALPSRVAEDLYWIGRYGERAEQTIRTARAVLARIGDTRDETPADGLDRLLACLAIQTGDATADDPDAAIGRSADGTDPVAGVAGALFDRDRRGSLVATVDRLVATATSVRELLSADTWQVLDDVRDELDELAATPMPDPGATQRALTRLLTSLLALAGLAAESTVRDPVWLFLDGGRRLERAQMLVGAARVTVVPVADDAADALVTESLLVAHESLITYRRRYRSRLQLASVLELLLADPDNPRSLAHQIDRLAEHAARLPRRGPVGRLTPVERLVLDAGTRLRLADLAALAAARDTTADGVRHASLDGFLADQLGLLEATGDALARHFLHVEVSRSLDERAEDPR